MAGSRRKGCEAALRCGCRGPPVRRADAYRFVDFARTLLGGHAMRTAYLLFLVGATFSARASAERSKVLVARTVAARSARPGGAKSGSRHRGRRRGAPVTRLASAVGD